MPDSSVLVERLVAADDECKRRRLEIERLQQALEAAEKDVSSLRGSCRALGDELRQVRGRLTACQRALTWIMHHSLPSENMPGWLVRTLKGLLREHEKPARR